MKIDEGLKTFWNVVEHMQHAADRRQPIHQVEETIFRDLLVIGNWLLQAFLDMAGTGDVGPTLRVASDSPSDPDQNLPRLEQPHGRPYLSIFGEVTIERTCYGQDRVEAAPLDAQLHLPQRQYSYLLQQWLGSFVVDDAHAEAIRKLETILGLEITVRASEDLNREQASDVEVFQDRLPVPNAAEEGPLLVVTADCKGVPLVRKASARRKRRPTPPCQPWRTRVGKGADFVAGERAEHSDVGTIGEHLCGGDGVMRRGRLGNEDIVALRQTRKAGPDIGASRGMLDVICIEIVTCGGGLSRARFPGLGGLGVPDLEAVVWDHGDITCRAIHCGRPIDVVTDLRKPARQQAARLEQLETEKHPGTGSHPLGEGPVRTLGKSVTASRSHHHTVCTGGDWLHRGHYTTDPSSSDEIPLQTRQGIS